VSLEVEIEAMETLSSALIPLNLKFKGMIRMYLRPLSKSVNDHPRIEWIHRSIPKFLNETGALQEILTSEIDKCDTEEHISHLAFAIMRPNNLKDIGSGYLSHIAISIMFPRHHSQLNHLPHS
jgi:hypothetical protein